MCLKLTSSLFTIKSHNKESRSQIRLFCALVLTTPPPPEDVTFWRLSLFSPVFYERFVSSSRVVLNCMFFFERKSLIFCECGGVFFLSSHVFVLRCTSSSFFCLFVLKNSLSVCVVFCLKNFIFFSLICPQICPLKKRATYFTRTRKEEKRPSFSPHCCCFSVLLVSFKEEERRTTKNYEEEEEDTQKRERKERTFAFTVLRAVVSERSLSSRDSFNATIL